MRSLPSFFWQKQNFADLVWEFLLAHHFGFAPNQFCTLSLVNAWNRAFTLLPLCCTEGPDPIAKQGQKSLLDLKIWASDHISETLDGTHWNCDYCVLWRLKSVKAKTCHSTISCWPVIFCRLLPGSTEQGDLRWFFLLHNVPFGCLKGLLHPEGNSVALPVTCGFCIDHESSDPIKWLFEHPTLPPFFVCCRI